MPDTIIVNDDEDDGGIGLLGWAILFVFVIIVLWWSDALGIISL